MMVSGERGWNLKRAINNRLGLTRNNDRLPKQFLSPYVDGAGDLEGYAPDFNSMLAAYYEARGWDAKTGFPTKKKLDSLDLSWISDDLYPHVN
jgi:aldehyde:ferredoxin oxidoreductase